MMDDVIYIPRLRQDIQLNDGPAEADGTPTWTLYDPAANKYYKIGWLEFEYLTRFDQYQTAAQLIEVLEAETTLAGDIDTVKHLINFLLAHNLVQANDPAVTAFLEKEHERRKKSLWEKILHGYLYFTIPIFRPQRFLEKTFPYVRFLFTVRFFSSALILFAYGIFLTTQRWDEFSHTFMSYFDMEGVALIVMTTVFVKIFHELSHAYTATKFGVPVPTMGIAMIVLYPVLYTETTNAWKLTNRSQRIQIAAAGVMGEIVLASGALFLWHVLPPGIGQSIAFMVAIVSLLATLLVNLNPLMRFDGYYLFSDLTGFDNLQDRSFAMAKWRLRRVLWGWDDATPEVIPPERQKFLEIFGFLTLVYRFFLFLGIAVLVYHLFVKPLGLILMFVEIALFIAIPVLKEVKVWWEGRDRISSSRRGQTTMALAMAVLISLFIPWQSSVDVPAMMHAKNYQPVYPIISSHLNKIFVSEGQAVKAGDILFELSSPVLEYEIRKAKVRAETLSKIRDREVMSPELANKRLTLDQDINAAEKELAGLFTQKEQLTVRAQHDGFVRDFNRQLKEGMWVSTKTSLCLIVDEKTPALTGYVSEQKNHRIKVGAQGTFYPDFSPFKSFKVVVSEVDEADTNKISWPELSSVYGGSLPADMGQDREPVARGALYTVKLRSKENEIGTTGAVSLKFAGKGVIQLDATPTSLAGTLVQRVISVIWRETGL